ncbi:hypothetical protein D3C72_340790 [compost metagenome]
MIQEAPTPQAAARHPFLALSPEARRHLARVLLAGLEASQDAEISRQTRHGAAGALALTALGTGLYQGWYQLTGLDGGPFAAWYGGYLAVQAGIASHLARRGHTLGPKPLRWLMLAPAEAVSAARSWLFPERLRPDRLVLAGGILAAIRHPVSYHLLRRLYGRAYPQIEVDRAIAVLRHLNLIIVKEREGSTVLLLAPAGVALLHELGVPEPVARPRQDPAIAPHLRPIFVALDRPGTRLPAARRDAPDQLVAFEQAPVAPPPPPPPPSKPEVSLPQLVREEQMPWEVEPDPEPVAVAPRPVVLPPVADEPELDDDEPEVAAPRERRRLTLPAVSKRTVAIAAAVAAVGLLAVFAARFSPTSPHLRPVKLTSAAMPSSQGQALGFNGRGLMLSSFGGSLFLSITDRLDYKRPMSFEGFDMAAGCGLKGGTIRTARMSPQGRFLWLEIDKSGVKPERCLVDLETKTVHHDLPAKNAAYGLPAFVGWAGESTLLMSEEPSQGQADRWWSLDVTTHQGGPLILPQHGRTMLLPMTTGAPLLVGLDMRRLGEWDLTTYWLDDKRVWQKLQGLRTTFPKALTESEPVSAAISPDKRYLLLTLRPINADATTKGSLVVVSLADGAATVMNGDVTAESPAFWGPDVRGGRYRFFYNGKGADGDMPWTGEMQAE